MMEISTVLLAPIPVPFRSIKMMARVQCRTISTPPTIIPLQVIDVGHFSTPAFADIDNDGDYDCLAGNQQGLIAYLENIGDPSNPIFFWHEDDTNPLHSVDVGEYSSPSFVDYDGDGDLDCFIGEIDGTILFYLNTGDEFNPIFAHLVGNDNPYYGVDVGDFSSPVFVDFDNDGKLDFFVGAGDESMR